MAVFDCSGIRLYLGLPERPDFKSTPLIYYRVEAIQTACEALKRRGVQFESEPHVVHETESMELWMAGFRDPDGNYIGLMTEVAI